MSFPQTNWTQVAQATLNGDTSSRAALAQMCADYREPLVSFLSSRGHAAWDSEDLVQEFFLKLLESRAWKRADRERGRFRTFLLGALMHVTAHAREKADAVKRGSAIDLKSLECLAEEDFEPYAVPVEVGRRFDSDWAFGLIKNTLHALAAEAAKDGREVEFAALRGFLPGVEVAPSYEELSARLGQPVAALKTKVHRMRGRFRELLRTAVARTVSAPHEVDEELAYLRTLLSQNG
ncbi:MAG: RNA polymerase subunit sigma-24 [Verrucomicrobiaceae bacterium]|nr:RNA polymerase subunit sigma-24 [Verrucomicrobiaceae bacterium]